MGRQNGDSTMVNSSIALLQERFRELQRVREKRQEKELLKMFSSESERVGSSTMHFEPTNFTVQPEMINPNTPPSSSSSVQDSLLSLGLNSQTRLQADFRATKSPSSFWPPNAAGNSSRSFENPDVDTSLHL